MPLVASSDLPSLRRLQDEGVEVLERRRALSQDIRELHIGLLNMMPDAALQVTERQFMRLVGASNRIAQFHVHPFTVPGLPRAERAQAHIERYYESFADLRDAGLDALIVTGANVIGPDLAREAFYEPMAEVLAWAEQNVTSVLCSCLSSHAAWKLHFGIDRTHLAGKTWGVFPHRVAAPDHPLVADLSTRFDVPHSRFNDVPREQLEAAGLRVLVASEEAGVLVAVSPDQFRFVYVQGHPEYDRNSLMKEYKREVNRFLAAERDDYPPVPVNYFSQAAEPVLSEYQAQVTAAKAARRPAPDFPETELEPLTDNLWADTARALFDNWLGLVYQVTHRERGRPHMDGVEPDDPLDLSGRRGSG